MSLTMENPSVAAGVLGNCACGGNCKQDDLTATPAKRQAKLSPAARAGLQKLHDTLQPAAVDDLSVASAISAARYLLRNY